MKKIILSGLVISLALGVTACSTKSESKNSNGPSEKKEESVSKNQFIFGKVKGIVGNEIEFELAKNPKGEIGSVEKEKEKEDKKGEVPAGVMTPATASEEGEKVTVGDIEKNKPLVELEFTGDLKTIVIPSGVNINVLSSRSGKGLEAIKEGTYLKLSVDDIKSKNPTILSVDVIS